MLRSIWRLGKVIGSFGNSTDRASLTNERAEEQAEEKDCTVEYSHGKLLQLDIDSDEDFAFFQEQWKRLFHFAKHLLEDTYSVRASSSGNRHVLIRLRKPLGVSERIMLQACLGSDRVREVLSYARFLCGEDNAILLFKPNVGGADYPDSEDDPTATIDRMQGVAVGPGQDAVFDYDHYEYEYDEAGNILRRREFEGSPGGMVRRKCRGCGRLLVIRRGRQRFVRAPYIWAGKAFCNSCAEVREQKDDTGPPWEEVQKNGHSAVEPAGSSQREAEELLR